MESLRTQTLVHLLKDPARIWNVCVVAHVDHGKTSLTDAMLASNNIISKKMTGLLRYLDFREDEQEREITMKASAVSLLARISPDSPALAQLSPDVPVSPGDSDAVINLVDSPGHIDFTFEVSSGLQLCDGALVVVDVVEGIAPQTVNLMKKVIDEGIQATLVLNKVDKLITLLNFQPADMLYQLSAIIEAANASMNIFIRARIQTLLNENPDLNEEALFEEMCGQEYFSAQKNNVLFASVVDGWGFRLRDLARMFAPKWKMDPAQVQKYMWGDYYYNAATKRISLEPANAEAQPIFVQFALGSIFKAYTAVKEGDVKMIQAIMKTFDLPPLPANVDLKKDRQAYLSTLLHSWMPIEVALAAMITEKLPNTRTAQAKRIANIVTNKDELLQWESAQSQPVLMSPTQIIRNIEESRADCAPVAITSKYVPVKADVLKNALPHVNVPANLTGFVGFSRLFCGEIRLNDKLLIKSKKNEISELNVRGLFLFLGQTLIPVERVGPGNLFGFWDPALATYKSGCIVPDANLRLLRDAGEQPLIQVRLQPKNLTENEALLEGLRVLNCVDPVCEIFNDEKGQTILAVNGEIHLERCLYDLEKDFAKIKIRVSEIIVNFRETAEHQKVAIEKNRNVADFTKQPEEEEEVEEPTAPQPEPEVPPEELDEDDLKKDYSEDSKFIYVDWSHRQNYAKNSTKKLYKKTKNIKIKRFDRIEGQDKLRNYAWGDSPSQRLSLLVQTLGLPDELSQFLTDQQKTIREMIFGVHIGSHFAQVFFDRFFALLDSTCKTSLRVLVKSHLQGFGPKSSGPNLLLNLTLPFEETLPGKLKVVVPWTDKERTKYAKMAKKMSIAPLTGSAVSYVLYDLATAFDNTVSKGPLCEEEIFGCCFIIEEFKLNQSTMDSMPNKSKNTLAAGTTSVNEEADRGTGGPSQPSFDVSDLEKPAPKVLPTEPVTLNLSPEEIQALQVQRTMKDAMTKSFLGASPKMMQGMFDVTAYCRHQNESQFCDIIKKKNGRILDMEFQNEVNLIRVQGQIPVHESFGFYSEVLTGTSGRVVPQLKFAGWEKIPENPFLEEQLTEEHVTVHGDTKVRNYAKELVRKIRQRKGLLTDLKIVDDDLKHSTMSRTR